MNKLTQHQQEAFDKLALFIDHNGPKLAVLEGYAGVGKTFLMGEFIKVAAQRMSVCVAAPTHKALKVICETLENNGLSFGTQKKSNVKTAAGGMFDAIMNKGNEIGLSAATIHSLLALKMTENENGTTECKKDKDRLPTISDYGLVVVDESSLISRDMFELILQYKGPATRVLFIGDPAQLPPIDDNGAISPVFTNVQYKVVLNEIVRQAADNPIIKLSMEIRNKDGKFLPKDFSQILPPLPAAAACLPGDTDTLQAFCVMEHQTGRDARILCYRNDSVKKMNERVHQSLHPGTIFAPGEKVLTYYCAGGAHGEKSPIKHYEEDFNWGNASDYGARNMEEFTVITCQDAGIEFDEHLIELKLESQAGHVLITKMPIDIDKYNQKINAVWSKYRQVNTAWQFEKDPFKKIELGELKRSLSCQAWAMKKSYPDLRHAYAMTVHRSQGSTFDTVLVHYADINAMKSAFEFNRAMYVACTRPRQYLAVVV